MGIRLVLLSLCVPVAASAFQIAPAPVKAAKAAPSKAASDKAPANASTKASSPAAPEVEPPLPKNNKVTRQAYLDACAIIVDAKVSEKKRSDANFCLDQEANAKHLSQLKKATIQKCTDILVGRNRKVTKEILREKMAASFGDEYTIVSAIACPQASREMQANSAPAAPKVVEKVQLDPKFDEGRFGRPGRASAPTAAPPSDGIDPEHTASTGQ